MKQRQAKNSMRRDTGSGPNMTPMVDVVMCILIFFMLGSAFLAPELVLANDTPVAKGLPDTNVMADVPIPPVRFILTLVRRGNVTWFGGTDGTLLRLDTSNGGTGREAVARYLADKRASMSDSVQVIIAPGENVPYQDVITVYDECGHAKFRQVAFAPPRAAKN